MAIMLKLDLAMIRSLVVLMMKLEMDNLFTEKKVTTRFGSSIQSKEAWNMELPSIRLMEVLETITSLAVRYLTL